METRKIKVIIAEIDEKTFKDIIKDHGNSKADESEADADEAFEEGYWDGFENGYDTGYAEALFADSRKDGKNE